MKAVNLLPREAVKERKPLLAPQNAPVLAGAGLGVVVAGALALGFLHESGAVSSAQSKLRDVQTQLANTPKPAQPSAQPVNPNAALAGQQSARLAAVTTALGARLGWDRILREFAQVLPDDVWLSSLSLQAPTGAAGGTTPSTDVTISGSTYSHDSVARLLERLALIPELSNVTLQSDSSSSQPTSSASSGGPALVTFTIAASVKLPAGATSLTAPPPPPAPAPTDTSTNVGATS